MAEQSHTFPLLEEETLEAVSLDFSQLGDGEKLRSVMEKYGMVIVKGVISAEEVKELEKLFGQDLASLIDTEALLASCPSSENFVKRVKAGVSEGEGDDELFSLLPELWPTGTRIGGRSFAIRCGLPQGRFAWGCRSKQNIRKIFSALHSLEEEELCVGLDTVFYTNPSLPHAEESNRLWPHADQNLAVPDSGEWDVYQSILYVQGSDEGQGRSTTIVWPKSHKDHFQTLMADEKIQTHGSTYGDHYAPFSDMKDREAAAALDSEYLSQARRVPIPSGGLLVWSSRTIHQGHAGGRRLAMPVCWEPRSRRTEATLRRKMRLLLMGMASTHWAALGNQHVHQPTSHKPLAASENEADLRAWVDYAEGVLAAGSLSFQHRAFNSTHLPCVPRVLPGCLLPEKAEEYQQLEEKVAQDEKSGFAWIDKDQALSEKIKTLFEEQATAAL